MKKLLIVTLSWVALSLTHSFGDNFEFLDSDGNGELSRSESQRSEDKDLQRYFSRVDKNGNGRISQDEYHGISSEKAKDAARKKAEAAKKKAEAAKKKKQNSKKKKKKKKKR